MILGVTGSMGCGKSYTCNKIVNLALDRQIDIVYIDFDVIRRKERKPYNFVSTMKKESQLVLFEWALLVEDGLLPLVDKVLLVKCDYETQLNRLIQGDLPQHEILRRINFQLSNNEKEEKIRQSGKSLFIFDSSDNPDDIKYMNLLEQILK